MCSLPCRQGRIGAGSLFAQDQKPPLPTSPCEQGEERSKCGAPSPAFRGGLGWGSLLAKTIKDEGLPGWEAFLDKAPGGDLLRVAIYDRHSNTPR